MRDTNSALVLIIMHDVGRFVVVASKRLGTSRTRGVDYKENQIMKGIVLAVVQGFGSSTHARNQ
jgi:hypothetical protein